MSTPTIHGSTPPPGVSAGEVPSAQCAPALARFVNASTRIRELEAERLDALADALAAVEGQGEIALRSLRAEAAALANVSEYQIDTDFSLAHTLSEEFPRLRDALRAGEVSVQHVRKLAVVAAPIGSAQLRVPPPGSITPAESLALLGAAGAELSALVRLRRAQFEEAMLPFAARLTANQVVPIAKKLVEQWVIDPIAARHAGALERRNVRVYDSENGMAELVALLPAIEAAAIHDRLTRIARQFPKTDPRGSDARRADALVGVMLGVTVPGCGGEAVVGGAEWLLPPVASGVADDPTTPASLSSHGLGIIKQVAVDADG